MQPLQVVWRVHIMASPNFITPASQMTKANWKATAGKFQGSN